MVIDFIYEKYEEQLMAALRDVFDEEEVEVLYEDGSVHEMVLKLLAKALCMAVFRGGIVEDIHRGVFLKVDGTKISQKYMNELNVDVCNRIYNAILTNE